MDSEIDSDSGGSHISATPPRDSSPPRPQRPPPPPAPLSSFSSKCKARVLSNSCPILKPKAASEHKKPDLKPGRRSTDQNVGAEAGGGRGRAPASSRPILKPKGCSRRRKPEMEVEPEVATGPSEVEPSGESVTFSSSNLPFQIRRSADGHRAGSGAASVENLPAGFFSKCASFSKIRKDSLNLESTDSGHCLPASAPYLGSENVEVVQTKPVQVKGEEVAARDMGSSMKKRLNLVGGSVEVTPLKRAKVSNEGNFVRLNINGYGHKRKFMNKGGSRRNQYSSRGKKHFKRWKKKSDGKDGLEGAGLCDEDGLVSEAQYTRKETSESFIDEGIKEAILSCREEASDENLVNLLQLTCGYDSFREGQLEAVKMVLSGKSTMLVLPTGAGKSLCYQLPAMILPGLTLVVSPLVALMIDQLKRLPRVIQGGLLSSNQKAEEISETLRMLQEGAIKVLFVSPERLLDMKFMSLFSDTLLVSLVVVDEAHCVSEWSHNFRPSYMRLRASLLRAKLNVDCILAMTATATNKTLQAVMSALEIPHSNLVQTTKLRDGLQLCVSASSNRMKDVIMLMKSPPFSGIKSIIIYCKFQFETDTISKYLCDNNISAKSYHSGIPTKDRNRTQELFCSNKIKAVVATVAFGMGLDKKDIGAVIHYSLPESLEEYVQEIGRAGRDGSLSFCHLLFDNTSYAKLRSLMFSDGVDENTVGRLLYQLFSNGAETLGKMNSLPRESASRKFDMKEEVLLTILIQLELGEGHYLQLLPQINATCTLNFHQTSPMLLAAKDFVVSSILKKSESKQGQYVFDIPTVANSIGISAYDLLNHLHNLKSKGEVTFETADPAYCYKILNVPSDACSLATQLTRWLAEVETCKVKKLDAMYNAAAYTIEQCPKTDGCTGTQHTTCLQSKILNYFDKDDDDVDFANKMYQSSPFLRPDIKVFLQTNSHVKFTPRAVARIMHGLGSPAFPTSTWSKAHFWGRYTHIDFRTVLEAAKAELMNFVGKNTA
uniref:DNA 3'-5' helicase n=1 Tax=Kalanchoe fedtschenkoi TaxID=63787 RepID=A0A7N0ZT59_KALFE